MRWLDAYRRQLVEEAAGRSDCFSRIIRVFRGIWIVLSICGVMIAGLMIGDEYYNGVGGGGGWSIIIGPVLAIVITIAGGIPYAFALLFLSVKRSNIEQLDG